MCLNKNSFDFSVVLISVWKKIQFDADFFNT